MLTWRSRARFAAQNSPHRLHRVRVDRESRRGVVLGFVHPGMGRAIDERIELQFPEDTFHHPLPRHVQPVARERNQRDSLPGLGVRTAHVMSELAVRANEAVLSVRIDSA